jgi:multiple sugar transport system substrate-binding protein
VSGCGLAGSSESASQAKPPAAEEKAAAPPKPIEMSVFYNSGAPEEQFNERWGNQLKKKFPHITFKYYQKKAGSALPDLITSGVTIDRSHHDGGRTYRYFLPA